MNIHQTTIPTDLAALETLVRRVVREEFRRLLEKPARSILEDWKQEGPNDPTGDALLLSDALAVLQKYKYSPQTWMSWEDFETELDKAEAAGELPR